MDQTKIADLICVLGHTKLNESHHNLGDLLKRMEKVTELYTSCRDTIHWLMSANSKVTRSTLIGPALNILSEELLKQQMRQRTAEGAPVEFDVPLKEREMEVECSRDACMLKPLERQGASE